VSFNGKDLQNIPTHIVTQLGVTMVPEGRGVFSRLTVQENLEMGAYTRKRKAEIQGDMERQYALFPRLKDRRRQLAGTLSGGEQQMLAMGRALMARPSLLLLDEPSMGLAPILVDEVFSLIQEINRENMTILLVEQNALKALSVAGRGYVIQTGEIVLHDTSQNLLQNEMMQRAYLGAK
jgi:branched-chain amino acid transport system ATP-binding protein